MADMTDRVGGAGRGGAVLQLSGALKKTINL